MGVLKNISTMPTCQTIAKYDAGTGCQASTVALYGGKVPKTLSDYSDGYKMKIEMAMGADVPADAEINTCFATAKKTPICGGAKAGENDGDLKSAWAVWVTADKTAKWTP